MVDYRESFVVGKRTFGIEDTVGLGRERFRTWASGCPIGSADTIEEARHLLWVYVCAESRALRDRAYQDAVEYESIVTKLADNPFGLAKFLTN